MLATKFYELHGVRVLECVPDGTKLRTYQDAVDLIGKTFEDRATVVVIPVECLEDEFFQLKTRVAGELRTRPLMRLLTARAHRLTGGGPDGALPFRGAAVDCCGTAARAHR